MVLRTGLYKSLSLLHRWNIQSLKFLYTSDTVAMVEVEDLDISARCRLRGVARASITKLATRVSELERKPELLHSDQLTAEQIQERLAGLDSEFKSYTCTISPSLPFWKKKQTRTRSKQH